MHRSVSRVTFAVKNNEFGPFAIHPQIPRIPRIPRIGCQRVRLGPYLPHAPGARMMVVKQTPSNEPNIHSKSVTASSTKLRRVIYYTLYRMDPQKTHTHTHKT